MWFRITLAAVRRMQEETPGARGNRLGDPADSSPGTTPELLAAVEVAAGDDGPGDAGHVGGQGGGQRVSDPANLDGTVVDGQHVEGRFGRPLALAFALALVTTQPVLAQSPEAPTATFMQSSKVEVMGGVGGIPEVADSSWYFTPTLSVAATIWATETLGRRRLVH